MNLQQRIDILVQLGAYMQGNSAGWQEAKQRAAQENGWFIPDFQQLAIDNICSQMLQKEKLEAFAASHQLPDRPAAYKTVGIVMAGNIPLVGFHDFLCVFLSGHRSLIKLSDKDKVLLKHLTDQLVAWNAGLIYFIEYAALLKNCDAYIATGSTNTSRYFEQYFGRYPHIIRRNRTSVALLTGKESPEELLLLADDIHLYFGLGCRNTTQVLVPEGYDFVPLLDACRKYSWMADHHKYKNNYDYNLALYILNKQYYMTNGSLLLIEKESPFSPISQLNYQYYNDVDKARASLSQSDDIQCVVGYKGLPFGAAQQPALDNFADGVNTLSLLSGLT
jgi:hypothetical protein